MAKRKNFEIRLNGELLATKHVWNASRREVEKMVKQSLKLMISTLKNCLVNFLKVNK